MQKCNSTTVLFHFQANGPAWPDAQPWDTLVFLIAAVVIVVLNRNMMFTREGAATSVLFPGDEGGTADGSSPARTDK